MPFELVLAVALPKGDRQKVLVEKLVELGVARLIPLLSERSVVVSNEKTVEKLKRRVIEASKQCGRNRLMEVNDPSKFDEIIGCTIGNRVLLHPYDSAPLSTAIENLEHQAGINLAIGPEGGFTSAEVAMARAAGWNSIALGPTILRVETAAVSAAALFGLGRLKDGPTVPHIENQV